MNFEAPIGPVAVRRRPIGAAAHLLEKSIRTCPVGQERCRRCCCRLTFYLMNFAGSSGERFVRVGSMV
jgi:hypothetical protein